MLILLLSTAACRRVTESTRAKHTRRDVESYGQLELTTQTRHTPLRDELSRLAGEDATPVQLTATIVTEDSGVPGLRRAGKLIADRDNAARGIVEAIPERAHHNLRRQFDELYPRDGVRETPQRMKSLELLLAAHQAEVKAYRQALARPDCDFGLQFTHGLLADMSFVEVALLGNRLLGTDALLRLQQDNPSQATAIVGDMLRGAQLLSEVANVTSRIAAARMRLEAFDIVQRIARHPKSQAQDFDAIYGWLADQWTFWPSEVAVWNGERALALHAYEMVRDGRLLSILTFEEVAELHRQGIEEYCARVYQHVDEDETFYLSTMRKVLEAAEQPYFQRHEVLSRIQDDLERAALPEARTTVAEILLRDLDWSQRVLARDRALLEGWSVAFALATGRTVPPEVRHPLTGKPYKIVQHKRWVEVSAVHVPGDDWPLIVEPLVVPMVAQELTAAPAPEAPAASQPTGPVGISNSDSP